MGFLRQGADTTEARDAAPQTVLIVDDHPLFRRGLKQLLAMNSAVTLIGEAASGTDALALARAQEPDLVLLDLNLKGESGLDVLAALKRQDAGLRVVMLTVSDAAEDLMAAIRAGADGYLLKDSEPETLLERLREVMNGGTAIDAALAGRLAAALRDEARLPVRSLDTLTEREREVLRLLAAGQSNKQIGRALSISDGTVKVHVKNVLKKLDFRSRVEAAVWMTVQLQQR